MERSRGGDHGNQHTGGKVRNTDVATGAERQRLSEARARHRDLPQPEFELLRSESLATNTPAALAAYAKQADDPELEVIARRIRARAFQRMGQLSRDLETSKGGRPPETRNSAVTSLKSEALEAAGVNRQTAHRAEKVAAIPEKEFERRGGGRN